MARSGSSRPTYVFENGKAYAFMNGQVFASADSIEELQQKVAYGDPGYDDAASYENSGGYMADQFGGPGQREYDDPNSPYHDPPCPKCGAREGAFEDQQNCMACGHSEQGGAQPGQETVNAWEIRGHPGEDDEQVPVYPHNGSTEIVTPNGLKGKVLGKVDNLWGDREVTVRLENGRIAHLRRGDFRVANEKTASAEKPLVESLRERLAASVTGDKESLKARETELRAIKAEAAQAVEAANEADAVALDSIVVEADYEASEVRSALAYLDAEDYEGFVPDAPFQASVVEQESVGRSASNWLDAVGDDMIREAETTDFQRLIDEGPEAFVAELDDAPLADQGVTRQMAASYIRTRTAGVQDDGLRDKYEAMWLARVEEVRRATLSSRKTQTHKEAAVERDEFESLPDDSLFI